MYIRKKKYPSGNIGIIVVEKVNGKMKELLFSSCVTQITFDPILDQVI